MSEFIFEEEEEDNGFILNREKKLDEFVKERKRDKKIDEFILEDFELNGKNIKVIKIEEDNKENKGIREKETKVCSSCFEIVQRYFHQCKEKEIELCWKCSFVCIHCSHPVCIYCNCECQSKNKK